MMPGEGQGGKPDHHDRSEGLGDLVGPLELKYKQEYGDHRGDQDQHRLAETAQRGNQQGALYGREDRDGRGDDAVSQQQRYTEIGEKGDEDHLPARLDHAHQNLAQYDGAPLPFAGEAHGQQGVLDIDQDHQGPDDQRDDAEDVFLGRFGQGDDDGQGVDRAGADVAEHQPH